MNEYYYYGLATMIYLTTCWTFSAVRWFHTCRAPKKEWRVVTQAAKHGCDGERPGAQAIVASGDSSEANSHLKI